MGNFCCFGVKQKHEKLINDNEIYIEQLQKSIRELNNLVNNMQHLPTIENLSLQIEVLKTELRLKDIQIQQLLNVKFGDKGSQSRSCNNEDLV